MRDIYPGDLSRFVETRLQIFLYVERVEGDITRDEIVMTKKSIIRSARIRYAKEDMLFSTESARK